MIMTEDYVSFEAAKLLKEKGFDYQGFDYIDFEGEVIRQDRPTHQMAMKWLREEKDVYICVIPRTNYNTLTYEYSIWYYTACERKVNWGEGINLITEKEFCCPTWEEAVESVVKYSLENLI